MCYIDLEYNKLLAENGIILTNQRIKILGMPRKMYKWAQSTNAWLRSHVESLTMVTPSVFWHEIQGKHHAKSIYYIDVKSTIAN